MERFVMKCRAGVPESMSVPLSRHFRVIQADADFRCKTENQPEFDAMAGIGYDLLTEAGEKFNTVTFTSEIDQEVIFYASNKPISDGRITGDVRIGHLPPVEIATQPLAEPRRASQWVNDRPPIYTTSANRVLLQNPERFKATLQATVDMWIWPTSAASSTAGIFIHRGETVTIDNTAELYARAVDANGSVNVMESVK